MSSPAGNPIRAALKAVLPKVARDGLRRAEQSLRLVILLRRVRRRVRAGEEPSRRLLERLRSAWGNDAFSAEADYLAAVLRAGAETRAPVLECGSGLTTLLLAITSQQVGNRVDVLEHSDQWAAVVRRHLRAIGQGGVHLRMAPLRRYDGFEWYDYQPDEHIRYGVVICDGPPEKTTDGARYGLLPVMRESLAPGANILLDDVPQPAQQEALYRWEREFGVRHELVESETRSFARAFVPELPADGAVPPPPSN